MAATDYIVTPKDIFRLAKLFGWRGIVGLFAGAMACGVAGIKVGYEAGVFVGLLVFWLIAGYSGRVFFGASIALLLFIMGLSIYDPNYEVGDTKVVEKLAVWVFYFMAIGVIKLLFETATGEKGPFKRTKNSVLPTATRSNQQPSEDLAKPPADQDTLEPQPEKRELNIQKKKDTAHRENNKTSKAIDRTTLHRGTIHQNLKIVTDVQKSTRIANIHRKPKQTTARPVHPVYNPTKKRTARKPKGPIQI